MIASLEGLSLHVTDLERSVDFYSKIPGAQMVAQRPGQFARFEIGSGSLHLVRLPGPRFHVELDVEDVEATHSELRAAGLDPATPKRHPWGKTDFRLTDPDGYSLEFGKFEGRP